MCRSISSVKGELIPHLVRRQWTNADGSCKTESARRLGWLSAVVFSQSCQLPHFSAYCFTTCFVQNGTPEL